MSQTTAKSEPRLLHMTTVPATLGFLVRQIEHAKQNGFEVHAVSASGSDLTKFGARAGIAVHELPMARRITPLRDLVSLWRLVAILRCVRPDIVHGHTPKGGLLAMIGAWLCDVPVRIYHIHGLPMVTATGWKRRLLRWTEKISCKLASQILCVSESIRAIAVAEGLCPAEKIKVLLNGTIDGVDAEHAFNPAKVDANAGLAIRTKFNIPANALILGFVGRIVRDKGMIELMQAWQRLREEFPNAHLLVVGAFEPQDPVPGDVERQLRDDPRVHLAGWIGVDEMPRYYRAIDLLVLPTYREGFNTVILEAAAMELPVVASRVPGCTDGVVEGETGCLVPAHDAGALTDAISAYLLDADLRRRHGLAGRQRVLRDYRPDDMCLAIHHEYMRPLSERGTTREPEIKTPAEEVLL